MFSAIVLVIHIIVCATLVLTILLQTGKGADIGAVFGGGGSHTLFGSTGATTFLSKVTIGAAITFMMTSIVLGIFAGRTVPINKSIMNEPTTTETQKNSQTVPVVPQKEGSNKNTSKGTSKENNPTSNKSRAPATNTKGNQPAKTNGGQTEKK